MRNAIGQNVHVRRLTPQEREVLCNSVEHAINSGRDEARIFWTEDRKHIYVAPLTIGEKSRLV